MQHQYYVSLVRGLPPVEPKGATMLRVVTNWRAMCFYKCCYRQFRSLCGIKHKSEMQFSAHKSSYSSTVKVAQSYFKKPREIERFTTGHMLLYLCLVNCFAQHFNPLPFFCFCCPTENICDAKHGWHLASHNALCHGPTLQRQLGYRDKRCLDWTRAHRVRSLRVKTYIF